MEQYVVLILGILLGVVANLLYPLVTNLAKSLLNQVPFEQNYLRSIQHKYGIIKSFGSSEIIRIDDVFVNPNFESIENPEAGKTIQIADLLKLNKKTIILGNPGTGKSTLLKYIVNAIATGKQETHLSINRFRFPIFIGLSNYGREFASFKSILENEVFSLWSDQKETRNIVQNMLERKLRSGECLILIDGLDEYGQDKKEFFNQIEAFSKSYPKNQIIIASRFFDNYDATIPRDFERYKLLEFSSKEIHRFITNWINAIELSNGIRPNPNTSAAIADRLFRSIQSNTQLISLSSNVLFLSLIITAFINYENIPSRKSELFSSLTNLMLDQWDNVKSINVTKYNFFTKQYVLESLAREMHARQVTQLRYLDLQRFIANKLAEINIRPNELDQIVDEICERSNLIIKFEPDIYRFSHFAFQEYFVARATTRLERDDASKFLYKSWLASKEWWKEPILLYSQLVSDATLLIDQFLLPKARRQELDTLNLVSECIANSVRVNSNTKSKVLEWLFDAYIQGDEKDSEQALQYLSKLKDDDILDWLIKSLKDEKPIIRGKAIIALSEIDLDTPKVRENLIVLMKDKGEFTFSGNRYKIQEVASNYLDKISNKSSDLLSIQGV